MKRYENKEMLLKAYVEDRIENQMKLALLERSEPFPEHEPIDYMREIYAGVGKTLMIYSPIFYRGGYVIPGFGFSTERIGKNVNEDDAGDASAVISLRDND